MISTCVGSAQVLCCAESAGAEYLWGTKEDEWFLEGAAFGALLSPFSNCSGVLLSLLCQCLSLNVDLRTISKPRVHHKKLYIRRTVYCVGGLLVVSLWLPWSSSVQALSVVLRYTSLVKEWRLFWPSACAFWPESPLNFCLPQNPKICLWVAHWVYVLVSR